MSPTGSDPTLDTTSYACDAVGTDAHVSRAAAHTHELRAEAQSVSSDSEDQENTIQTSNLSSEHMYRIEGLIAGMAQQQDLFMTNQLQTQGSQEKRPTRKVGADFKAWGLRFLQKLGAAQLMSGTDWPELFKILELNGMLEGVALNYLLPVWTAMSNTLEFVMNSMLLLYMTPIPSTKWIEMISVEKD
uniref:Uncharacterized protein AlNc14C55G4222 n=1 Tax=Albugo laibachii Nc14 TaxID=890382 RepID=F0WC38_9STRA|nr:conserved hypothetical protein [Albugo laibachii Nc14]|eukprot:CCA18751.1 conserved hypothetical protein [Albugo laibachii Nc14]